MNTKPTSSGPDAAETTTSPKSLGNPAEFRKRANSTVQRNYRKIGRDVHRAYMTMGRIAGLEPDECNAAFALDELLYDKQGQDTETPRKVPLAEISKSLTSGKDASENNDAGWQKAQRAISHLFVHAYPRIGLAMQIREKGLNLGDGHMYASRWMNAAAQVAEDFDQERRRILSSDTIKREDKGRAIGEAHERLCREALGYFDKLDTLIIEKNKPFAVVTGPQAEAFHKLNADLFKGERPKFKTAPYTYTPPPEPDKDAPFSLSQLEEMGALMVASAEKKFWMAIEKTDVQTASRFIRDTKRDFDAMCARVIELAGNPGTHTQNGTYKEKEELIHAHENEYDAPAADDQEPTPVIFKNEYDGDGNMTEPNNLEIDGLATRPNGAVDNPAETPSTAPPSEPGDLGEVVPVTVALEGSINYGVDEALKAALDYVRDGWAVVPCCQFNPATGRCTEARHNPPGTPEDEICMGKVPLLAGRKDAKPGDGYTAACRDEGKVADYFTRLFPNAGVAIRMDNINLGDCILLDVDVKDGARGPESFDELDATFSLPATLTAITPSGGRHYVYKLPDGLPADYLGSWTGIMPGLDLKYAHKGLEHVEPTVGKTGIYRWVDSTADIAELPRECCDHLHRLHKAKEQAKLDEARAKAEAFGVSADAGPFDPDEDQAKYVKDAAKGKRRPRLRSVACGCAKRGATVEQIVGVLKFHDSQFKQVGPTNDYDFMLHVAQGAVMKFGQGVAQ